MLAVHPDAVRTGNAEEDRLLADVAGRVDAGAPLDFFDAIHKSSPIGWAVHGSRYSGGAEERQYADPGDAYLRRLLHDATPQVREVLEGGIQVATD